MYGNTETESASDNPSNHNDLKSASVPTSKPASDMILYIVFGVALAVFLLVLIIIVKILRRKNPNPNGYTLTSTGMKNVWPNLVALRFVFTRSYFKKFSRDEI